jgi:hypothetical protein
VQGHAHHEAGPVEAVPLGKQVALRHIEGLHLRLRQSSRAAVRGLGGGQLSPTQQLLPLHRLSLLTSPRPAAKAADGTDKQ